MEIADAGFLLRAERPAAEGAGLQIALGNLADVKILAHDLAVGLDGAVSRRLLAAFRELEVIDQPAFGSAGSSL